MERPSRCLQNSIRHSTTEQPESVPIFKTVPHRKGADYEKTLDRILGALRGRAAIIALLARVALFLGSVRGWRLDDK